MDIPNNLMALINELEQFTRRHPTLLDELSPDELSPYQMEMVRKLVDD